MLELSIEIFLATAYFLQSFTDVLPQLKQTTLNTHIYIYLGLIFHIIIYGWMDGWMTLASCKDVLMPS